MSDNSMPINAQLPYGATALNPDDLEGLIPDYINSRKNLNEFEKNNIQQALLRIRRVTRPPREILTIGFCIKLHFEMFNKTWRWAGTFRRREVNIGNTAPEQIAMQLRGVLDNALYWIDKNIFPVDEICLRVHRDIVWVHPFPNGNGRHSRILCDELRRSLGAAHFSWGGPDCELVSTNVTRKKYIQALKEADRGNFQPLINFATFA